MRLFKRKERTLGVAQGKRRYDLPLNAGQGSGFLMLLIALMTILAVLALAASFTLSGIAERWTTGLENHYTIEVPATDKDGKIRTKEDIREDTAKLTKMLNTLPYVSDVAPLSQNEIHELIEPWIGDESILEAVPVPGLIALKLQGEQTNMQSVIEKKIRNIVPNAMIDSHQEWLQDVLKFTNSMTLATAMLVLIIAFISITAVASGIRARISIHETEVELLHLMGASDNYISGQFQRYAALLAFKAALVGTALGIIALFAIRWFFGEMSMNLMPHEGLSAQQISMFISLPFMAGLIALLTSRQTVLNVLVKMP